MKRKKVFLFIFFLMIGIIPNLAQQGNGVYEYPIKPGTDKWKELTDHQQMIDVCQIPEEFLTSMTTADLLRTCLDYPLYIDIFTFNNLQQGFNSVTKNFNGLRELLSRNDVGLVALNLYKSFDPIDIKKLNTPLEKGLFAREIASLELLIAQEKALSSLSLTDKTELLKECIIKLSSKNEHPVEYGLINFRNIGMIIGRILISENYSPLLTKINIDEKLKLLLSEGKIFNMEYIELLSGYATDYLKNK